MKAKQSSAPLWLAELRDSGRARSTSVTVGVSQQAFVCRRSGRLWPPS